MTITEEHYLLVLLLGGFLLPYFNTITRVANRVMGPGPEDKAFKAVTVEKLATDGSNWPLWKATMLSYFKSKNLISHIEGTAVRPHNPTPLPVGIVATDEIETRHDKQVDRLEEEKGK